MSKLPAFQFYPGDWRKDPGVQALDYHHRGIWFEMLCLMHESEQRGKLILNGKSMPLEALARLLGLDKQILTTALTTLLTYGVASQEEDTGVYFCRRMVRDEYIRSIRSEAGKLGGNPNLVKQKSTKGCRKVVKQIPTPSSSSSSSSSISVSTSVDKEKGAVARSVFVIPSVEEIRQYCQERSNQVDPDQFSDYYAARGWELSKGRKMKDWRAAVRTWEKNGYTTSNGKPKKTEKQTDAEWEAAFARKLPEDEQ